MRIRADIAELMRAGHSDAEVCRRFHIDHRTAARIREALELPKAKRGIRPAASAEDLFRRRVQPVDGGHLLWTGHVNNTGAPCFRHGGKMLTAYRVAFRIQYGREPVGKVTSACDRKLCVAPQCVEDRLIRERTKATFAAIFGGTS
jgi:hypothetical protein